MAYLSTSRIVSFPAESNRIQLLAAAVFFFREACASAAATNASPAISPAAGISHLRCPPVTLAGSGRGRKAAGDESAPFFAERLEEEGNAGAVEQPCHCLYRSDSFNCEQNGRRRRRRLEESHSSSAFNEIEKVSFFLFHFILFYFILLLRCIFEYFNNI